MKRTLFAFSVYVVCLLLTFLQPAFGEDEYGFDLSEIEKEVEKNHTTSAVFLSSDRFFSVWTRTLPFTRSNSMIKTRDQPWNNTILVFASREAITRAL